MNVNFLRKKKIYSYAASLCLMLITYIYLTPYFSILGFKSAIEAKDSNKASKYIDFISVRRSLKDQLLQKAISGAQKQVSGSALGELSMLFINPILEKIVDATVEATITPSGLELLLTKGKISTINQEGISTPVSDNDQKKNNEPKINLHYNSVNTFILSSKMPNYSEPIVAFWKRSKITTWKLHRIDLPMQIKNEVK
ncbi:DUF2939 domain-containing protein [Prochlorococcus marinus]|uniref:DUF2939 domain-containing protein n=1 Tax=Prochlorococcus marinus TaxID=1219 RepID=UPI0022B4C26A|nr:DUF2939 domain-containing protein [Prochlorococcus marinus]